MYSVTSTRSSTRWRRCATARDWSPDGRTIAFATRRRSSIDLWLMDADGTNERILASDIDANHGVGPVWSPDGERIVYQELCDVQRQAGPAREEHEVVLITVNQNGDAEPATQVLQPPNGRTPRAHLVVSVQCRLETGRGRTPVLGVA